MDRAVKMERPHNNVPITVILLNFNGGQILQDCIQSFLRQSAFPEKLLFVDNGSEHWDEAAIRESFGERYEGILEFLRIEENVGYVKGMNQGLQKILEGSGYPDWVMTLSNDTELESDFFKKLDLALQALDKVVLPDTRIGMLAPKIRAMSAPYMLDATGIAVSLDGMSTARGQRELDLYQYDSKVHILIPNGVSAIYRVSMLKDVGLMDEDFWAYCEDTDLGLRAWLAGWDCRFLPECIVYHARSATLGEHSLNKLYLVERNHYWVAIKNLPCLLLFLNPLLSFYRYLVQVYAVLSRKGQGLGYTKKYRSLDLMTSTLKGILHAITGSPRAFTKRMRLRSLKRRPSLEVLHTLWRKRLRFDQLILK